MSSITESKDLLRDLFAEILKEGEVVPVSFGDVEVGIDKDYFSEEKVSSLFDQSLIDQNKVRVLGSYSSIKSKLQGMAEKNVIALLDRINPFPQNLEFQVMKRLESDDAFMKYVKETNPVEFNEKTNKTGSWPSSPWSGFVYGLHTSETSGAVGMGEILLTVMFNLAGAGSNAADIDVVPVDGGAGYSVKSGVDAKVNNKFQNFLNKAWEPDSPFVKLSIAKGEVIQETIIESILKYVKNQGLRPGEEAKECTRLMRSVISHMETVKNEIIKEKIILCNTEGWKLYEPAEMKFLGTDGRQKLTLSPKLSGKWVKLSDEQNTSAWDSLLENYARHPTASSFRRDIATYEGNIGLTQKDSNKPPTKTQIDAMSKVYRASQNILPYYGQSPSVIKKFLEDVRAQFPNLKAAKNSGDVDRSISSIATTSEFTKLLSFYRLLPLTVPAPTEPLTPSNPSTPQNESRGRNRTPRSEVSMIGGANPVAPGGMGPNMPMGFGPKDDGSRRRKGKSKKSKTSSILQKNALSQGKFWARAKPVNEASSAAMLGSTTAWYLEGEGVDIDGDGNVSGFEGELGVETPIYRGGGGDLAKQAEITGRAYGSAEAIEDLYDLISELLPGRELTPSQTRRFKRTFVVESSVRRRPSVLAAIGDMYPQILDETHVRLVLGVRPLQLNEGTIDEEHLRLILREQLIYEGWWDSAKQLLGQGIDKVKEKAEDISGAIETFGKNTKGIVASLWLATTDGSLLERLTSAARSLMIKGINTQILKPLRRVADKLKGISDKPTKLVDNLAKGFNKFTEGLSSGGWKGLLTSIAAYLGYRWVVDNFYETINDVVEAATDATQEIAEKVTDIISDGLVSKIQEKLMSLMKDLAGSAIEQLAGPVGWIKKLIEIFGTADWVTSNLASIVTRANTTV